MEDSDGVPVSKARLKQIRKVAYSIFFQLNQHGMAPDTWKKAGLDVVKEFRAEMELQVPELRLCSQHWKATNLPTLIYPTWSASHLTQPIKEEPISDDDGDDNDPRVPLKRPSPTAAESKTHKKLKPTSKLSAGGSQVKVEKDTVMRRAKGKTKERRVRHYFFIPYSHSHLL